MNQKIRRKFYLTTSLLMVANLLVTNACVTVNVNFPESAVQQATDDYVKELYRAKDRDKSGKPADDSSTSSFRFEIFASAHAAEPRLKLDSPKASAIQKRLAANLDKVLKYKRMGLLGESKDGMLVVRKEPKLKDMADDLKKTVTTENAARKELYSEVASSNQVPEGVIEKSFARSFQAESPSSTWVESDGNWEQKP